MRRVYRFFLQETAGYFIEALLLGALGLLIYFGRGRWW